MFEQWWKDLNVLYNKYQCIYVETTTFKQDGANNVISHDPQVFVIPVLILSFQCTYLLIPVLILSFQHYSNKEKLKARNIDKYDLKI